MNREHNNHQGQPQVKCIGATVYLPNGKELEFGESDVIGYQPGFLIVKGATPEEQQHFSGLPLSVRIVPLAIAVPAPGLVVPVRA